MNIKEIQALAAAAAFPSVRASLTPHDFSVEGQLIAFTILNADNSVFSLPLLINEHSTAITEEDRQKWLSVWPKSEVTASDAVKEFRSGLLLEDIRQKLQKSFKEAKDSSDPLHYFAQDLNDYLRSASQNLEGSVGALSTFAETARLGLLDAQRRVDNPHDYAAYSTGFESLDSLIRGYRPGEQIFVAAGPGIGKTTLVTFQLMSLASMYGRCIFHSCEMTRQQMSERLAHSLMGVEMWRAPRAADVERGLENLSVAADDLESSAWNRILVDYRVNPTLDQVVSQAKLEKEKNGLVAIVFDHLAFWNPAGRARGGSEYEKTTAAVQESKIAAKEIDVPLIMLHHLSRGRFDQDEPNMGMLRATGAVENYADIVIMLWPVNGRDNAVGVHVLKGRQSGRQAEKIGKVLLGFDPATQTFYDEGVMGDPADGVF